MSTIKPLQKASRESILWSTLYIRNAQQHDQPRMQQVFMVQNQLSLIFMAAEHPCSPHQDPCQPKCQQRRPSHCGDQQTPSRSPKAFRLKTTGTGSWPECQCKWRSRIKERQTVNKWMAEPHSLVHQDCGPRICLHCSEQQGQTVTGEKMMPLTMKSRPNCTVTLLFKTKLPRVGREETMLTKYWYLLKLSVGKKKVHCSVFSIWGRVKTSITQGFYKPIIKNQNVKAPANSPPSPLVASLLKERKGAERGCQAEVLSGLGPTNNYEDSGNHLAGSRTRPSTWSQWTSVFLWHLSSTQRTLRFLTPSSFLHTRQCYQAPGAGESPHFQTPRCRACHHSPAAPSGNEGAAGDSSPEKIPTDGPALTKHREGQNQPKIWFPSRYL